MLRHRQQQTADSYLISIMYQGLALQARLGDCGCLGAGTGAGSCPAAPFRAEEADIDHKSGCPSYAECCTEYGYCHPKVSAGG